MDWFAHSPWCPSAVTGIRLAAIRSAAKASTNAKNVSSSTTPSRDAKINCDMRFNLRFIPQNGGQHFLQSLNKVALGLRRMFEINQLSHAGWQVGRCNRFDKPDQTLKVSPNASGEHAPPSPTQTPSDSPARALRTAPETARSHRSPVAPETRPIPPGV